GRVSTTNAGYEVRCPTCGHRWQSTSFSGRTTCAECRTRVYVPVADRPAHVAEVGRQLRRQWRDRATKTDERPEGAPRVRRPARPRTVWRDDDAGYDPDECDDDTLDDEPERWDDDGRDLDDEDETEPAGAHRAGDRGGRLGAAASMPRTLRGMLEA